MTLLVVKEYLRNNNVRNVSRKMCVKFEVRRINHFGAIIYIYLYSPEGSKYKREKETDYMYTKRENVIT